MQQDNSNAYLIIRQGTRWTDVFRLDPSRPLIVGRASSNEIPVADERASRRHAEIFFDNGWKIRDLGSRNGTIVDGAKITQTQPLTPGNTIVVASCRMSFSSSLEEVAPAIEPEEFGHDSTRVTDIEPSNIIHRQAKSAILAPDALDLPQNPRSKNKSAGSPDARPGSRDDPSPRLSTSHAHTAAPHKSLDAHRTLTLLQLAFELARESDLYRGCDVALERLHRETKCNSAGILQLKSEDQPALERKVVATLQKTGRAYHPVSDTLVLSVLRDGTAVLARNIHDSALAGSNPAGVNKSMAQANASQILNTSSAILAPIRSDGKCIGFVHLYSRIGEPDLTPEDLEITLAIADVVGTFLSNIQKQQSLESKLVSTRSRLSELELQLGKSDDWVGNSPAMNKVREQAERVGPTNATVLLRGESGAGKEVVARHIHQCSQRASSPFVAMNCAALTPTLLESELFGHEKGAFTGATERKLGKFEQAHTGTIMLDELGEMSLEIQAKFLRILEGKPFERVGGNKPISVDVRVIAATNKDLEQAVAAGQFRADLYFRLRVIELRIPPLRERSDDILAIAEFFLNQFRSTSGHGPNGFSSRAKSAMLAYAWPGNVRELRNAVERAYVLSTGDLAEPEDLALSYLQIPGQSHPSGDANSAATSQGYRERTLDDLEAEHIAATLEFTGGQKNRAAAILGIERSTLDRKLKRIKGE